MKTKNNERKERKTKTSKSLEDSIIFNFELKDNYFSLSENSNNISLKLVKCRNQF